MRGDRITVTFSVVRAGDFLVEPQSARGLGGMVGLVTGTYTDGFRVWITTDAFSISRRGSTPCTVIVPEGQEPRQTPLMVRQRPSW